LRGCAHEGAEGRISAKERPDTNCIPLGVPQSYEGNLPKKIIQEPGLVVILHEAFGVFRQIFLDGRPLPKDPNPTWMGYSVGHWEGDTLVVETTGFNGKKWLDLGPPIHRCFAYNGAFSAA
jgi:hypothetical protein